MGAKRKTSGTVQFFRIFDGKIIKAVDSPTEHSKEYKSHTGKVFLAEPFESIEGKLDKYYVFTENWENKETDKLCIQLRDTETNELMCLTERLDSDCASSLIQRIHSVDLSEAFEIVAMLKDKQFNYAFIKQNGVIVKSQFTAENPLPQWKKVTINNKVVWDKTDCLNRLKELVKERADFAKLSNNQRANAPEQTPTENSTVTGNVNEDDFPF